MITHDASDTKCTFEHGDAQGSHGCVICRWCGGHIRHEAVMGRACHTAETRYQEIRQTLGAICFGVAVRGGAVACEAGEDLEVLVANCCLNRRPGWTDPAVGARAAKRATAYRDLGKLIQAGAV